MRASTGAALRRAVVTVAVLCSWAFVIANTVPRITSGEVFDYGFFLSVADRLRAGEALYGQIWDNKDPFTYYSIALARLGGAPGGWLLEVLWVALSAVAVFVVARKSALTTTWAVFVAFALAPVVILGMPYFMGTTYLPGIALALLGLALMATGHPRLSGISFALLLFFKLLMWPVALAAVVVYAIATRARRSLLPFAAAGAITSAAVLVLLAIRGELAGFIETQIDNVDYSQSPIVTAEYTGLSQKIAQHLVVLVNPHILMIGLASVAILATAAVLRRVNHRGVSWFSQSSLWWTALSAFAAAGIIVAVTGKWFYHAEIFAVSSVLLLVVLVASVRVERRAGNLLTAIAALVATFLLAAAPSAGLYTDAFRSLPQNWTNARETDPLTTIMQARDPSTVAFIGSGYALPKSGGLGDWQVVCRYVAQRPFNPQKVFDETIACLPTADLVIVTEGDGPDTNFPAFNDFYTRAGELLAEGFDCEQEGDFRLCTRRR